MSDSWPTVSPSWAGSRPRLKTSVRLVSKNAAEGLFVDARAIVGAKAAPTIAETTPRRERVRRRAMSGGSWVTKTPLNVAAKPTAKPGGLFPLRQGHDVLLCRQLGREPHHLDVDQAGRLA